MAPQECPVHGPRTVRLGHDCVVEATSRRVSFRLVRTALRALFTAFPVFPRAVRRSRKPSGFPVLYLLCGACMLDPLRRHIRRPDRLFGTPEQARPLDRSENTDGGRFSGHRLASARRMVCEELLSDFNPHRAACSVITAAAASRLQCLGLCFHLALTPMHPVRAEGCRAGRSVGAPALCHPGCPRARERPSGHETSGPNANRACSVVCACFLPLLAAGRQARGHGSTGRSAAGSLVRSAGYAGLLLDR